jgi:hypothetical protein
MSARREGWGVRGSVGGAGGSWSEGAVRRGLSLEGSRGSGGREGDDDLSRASFGSRLGLGMIGRMEEDGGLAEVLSTEEGGFGLT